MFLLLHRWHMDWDSSNKDKWNRLLSNHLDNVATRR